MYLGNHGDHVGNRAFSIAINDDKIITKVTENLSVKKYVGYIGRYILRSKFTYNHVFIVHTV